MSVILKEKITGPAAWKGPDIAADPAWLYHFTPDDIAVLDAALATLKALSRNSPTALKVTLELLRRARTSKSLKECLVREYNSALTVFTSTEFVEGVRAAIIDKDRNPKWSPARIEDVTPDIVEKYFTPNPKYTLVFPD